MFNSQQIIARTYKSTVFLYDTLSRSFMLSTLWCTVQLVTPWEKIIYIPLFLIYNNVNGLLIGLG